MPPIYTYVTYIRNQDISSLEVGIELVLALSFGLKKDPRWLAKNVRFGYLNEILILAQYWRKYQIRQSVRGALYAIKSLYNKCWYIKTNINKKKLCDPVEPMRDTALIKAWLTLSQLSVSHYRLSWNTLCVYWRSLHSYISPRIISRPDRGHLQVSHSVRCLYNYQGCIAKQRCCCISYNIVIFIETIKYCSTIMIFNILLVKILQYFLLLLT